MANDIPLKRQLNVTFDDLVDFERAVDRGFFVTLADTLGLEAYGEIELVVRQRAY